MMTSNIFRALGLGLAGASVAPYWWLVIIGMPVGFLGTYVGKRLFDGMDDRWFNVIFKALITILAFIMFYKALA